MPDAAESSVASESDVAYLKRLVSAGRGEPAPFLLLMAVFGGAYGLSISIIVLGLLSEGSLSPTDASYQPGPIVVFGNQSLTVSSLAFLAALFWTGWRTFGPNRVRLSRAASATWSGAFISLVATFFAFHFFTRGQSQSESVHALFLLPPVLLVLWGCAWWVTAILSDRPWLLAVAAGSFGAAIAMAVVVNGPLSLPVIAACLLLLAFLPAVILMRERRR